MNVISDAEIDFVKEKLSQHRLLDLNSREICIYTFYRLCALTKRLLSVSTQEMKYNFGEVGPGKRRMDPWALELILHSDLFSRINTFPLQSINNLTFYFNEERSKPFIQDLTAYKKQYIETVINNLVSEATLTSISNEIIRVVGKDFEPSEIYVDPTYVELILRNKSNSQKFLLRFCPGLDWIYPSDKRIWSLYRKAATIAHVPILVAEYIHGMCFPIFKAIGLLARHTYYHLLHQPEFPTEPSNHHLNKALQTFSIGRMLDIRKETLEFLLPLLKENGSHFFEAFLRKQEKVITRLPDDFPSQNNVSSIKEKVMLCKSFLSELKLQGVSNTKATLEKYEKIISET